jgi:hypothetical protein
MTTNRQLTDAALEVALARYAARVSAVGLQASIMADVAATEQVRRPLLALPDSLARPAAPGRLAAIPTVAWVLLLVGLLLGLVVGGLAGGPWRDSDRAAVIAPSPWPMATIDPAVATILATTKAKPLPVQATCPPGSAPDSPGPADQERPPDGGMAFDRHAGRIVTWAADGTWTFDVCTNTWHRMRAAQGPGSTPDEVEWLVYDADSDLTVASTPSGQFWSYDLAADRWTKAGWFPEIRRGWGWGSWRTGAVYHDPSGLIVIYDGATLWAYDVEAGSLAEIPQLPDPSRPPGEGIPADPLAPVDEASHYDPSGGDFIGYDPRADRIVALVRPARPGGPRTPRPPDETWTLDPGSGTWRFEPEYRHPGVGFVGMGGGPATYDEVSGLMMFPAGLVLDTGQRRWRRLELGEFGKPAEGFTQCAAGPVYDPVNEQLVCLGGARYAGEGPEDLSGVSASSPAKGRWHWLVEPLPTSSPTP